MAATLAIAASGVFAAGFAVGQNGVDATESDEYRALESANEGLEQENAGLAASNEVQAQDLVTAEEALAATEDALADAEDTVAVANSQLEELIARYGNVDAREAAASARESALTSREADLVAREAAAGVPAQSGYVDRDGVWWPSAREWAEERCGLSKPEFCTPEEEAAWSGAEYWDVISDLAGG